MGDRLRAIIADAKRYLTDLRDWQIVSSQLMRHLWLSDCESLVSHLHNPKNERLENVRLSIDIQGLKQMLWEKPDGTNLDELEPATIAANTVRWIDTSCMIVDCLTKRMKPTVFPEGHEDRKVVPRGYGRKSASEDAEAEVET